MGLFKSIKKGVSKVWNGVKKVFKKVGKALKKVVASKWFKIGMLVLSVYTMGAASGLFGAGGGGAGTAAGTAAGEAAGTAAGEAATQAATTAAAEGATQAATTAAAEGATQAATQAASAGIPGAATDIAGQTVGQVGGQVAGQTVGQTAGQTVGQVAGQEASKGLISTIGDYAGKVGSYVQDNPNTALLAGNVISSLAAPDPYEEQMKYEEEQRKKGNVFGVLGTGEVQGQLLDPGKFVTSQRQSMSTRAQQNQGVIARAQELSEALQPTAPRQFGRE